MSEQLALFQDLDSMSLGEARRWLSTHQDKGVHCPVCDQFSKVYHRKITSTSARALIIMFNQAGTEFVHTPTLLQRKQADEVKMQFWGLIEEERVRRPDGGRAAFWRVTERGVEFIHARLRVPKYAWIYNGKLLGFDHDRGTVSITEALGTKFNYTDLMEGR